LRVARGSGKGLELAFVERLDDGRRSCRDHLSVTRDL
jgi:hypothetical protein